MDAGVVSGLLQLATQESPFAEKTSRLKSAGSKRPATASGCGGALATPPHTIFQQPARSRVRLIAVILKNRIHALLDRPSRVIQGGCSGSCGRSCADRTFSSAPGAACSSAH